MSEYVAGTEFVAIILGRCRGTFSENMLPSQCVVVSKEQQMNFYGESYYHRLNNGVWSMLFVKSFSKCLNLNCWIISVALFKVRKPHSMFRWPWILAFCSTLVFLSIVIAIKWLKSPGLRRHRINVAKKMPSLWIVSISLGFSRVRSDNRKDRPTF